MAYHAERVHSRPIDRPDVWSNQNHWLGAGLDLFHQGAEFRREVNEMQHPLRSAQIMKEIEQKVPLGLKNLLHTAIEFIG